MNCKQRFKNRATAQELARTVRALILSRHTCENCGEKGGHWIATRGLSVQAMVTGVDDQEGFWICPKLYGHDGLRIDD